MSRNLTHITYTVDNTFMGHVMASFHDAITNGIRDGTDQMVQTHYMDRAGGLEWMCGAIMGNTSLIKHIAEANFDIVFLDGFYMTRCFRYVDIKNTIYYFWWSDEKKSPNL